MKIIPFSGSGDFMVDMKDVRVSMIAVLRNNDDGNLNLEHFDGNIVVEDNLFTIYFTIC